MWGRPAVVSESRLSFTPGGGPPSYHPLPPSTNPNMGRRRLVDETGSVVDRRKALVTWRGSSSPRTLPPWQRLSVAHPSSHIVVRALRGSLDEVARPRDRQGAVDRVP